MARTAGSATRNDGSAISTVTPIETSGGPAGNVDAGFRSGRLWGALVIVEFFNLLSAVGGGVALVTSRGLGMPHRYWSAVRWIRLRDPASSSP